jgi:hypothetical protein
MFSFTPLPIRVEQRRVLQAWNREMGMSLRPELTRIALYCGKSSVNEGVSALGRLSNFDRFILRGR